MRKYLIVCIMALAACACNRFRTDVYTFDELLVPRTDSLSTLYISISLEYPVKGAPQEVLDTMTSIILTAAFDLEEGVGRPEGTAEGPGGNSALVERTAADYISDIKESFFNGDPINNPYVVEDEVNGYFSASYGKYHTYMIEYYAYLNDGQGHNTCSPIVFDSESGLVVPEEEFFVDDYAEGVSQLMKKHVMDNPEDGQLESIEAPCVEVNGNYELGKDGVTWYFQPLEIAPYVYNVITVTVPWSELKPWLR